jgi:thiol-disulfide isomerase/thioredoxin
MLNRRSFLSNLLLPAALGTGLVAAGAASGRSSGREFVGVDSWFNTDRPLTLAELRGSPLLVEFGTYTCINWRRTLPYVKRWNSEYGPQGLRIVGVHTPEFSFERTRAYIDHELRELGVFFPIAQDNEFKTWRAFDNEAWPSFYLFDKEGRLRLRRDGEGHSAEIEDAIRTQLGLARGAKPEDVELSRIGTPEFYFGSLHGTPQDPSQSPRDGERTYGIAGSAGPHLNEYDLQGTWVRAAEPLTLRSDVGKLRVRFSAAKLHLVAGAPQPAPIRVRVGGGAERMVEIGLPTLYTLLDGDSYGEHVLEVELAAPGLTLYSATFG